MSDEKKPKRRVIWCATCGVAVVFEWSRPTSFPNEFQAAMARLTGIHGHLARPDSCTELECKMSTRDLR